MLPLVLNPANLKTGLAGRGPERDRRAALLAEAGVEVRLLPEPVPDALLASLQVLFVAGIPEGEARDLAARARAQGVLVNVEDVLPLCDFHVPAIVRRGELLLTEPNAPPAAMPRISSRTASVPLASPPEKITMRRPAKAD